MNRHIDHLELGYTSRLLSLRAASDRKNKMSVYCLLVKLSFFKKCFA